MDGDLSYGSGSPPRECLGAARRRCHVGERVTRLSAYHFVPIHVGECKAVGEEISVCDSPSDPSDIFLPSGGTFIVHLCHVIPCRPATRPNRTKPGQPVFTGPWGSTLPRGEIWAPHCRRAVLYCGEDGGPVGKVVTDVVVLHAAGSSRLLAVCPPADVSHTVPPDSHPHPPTTTNRSDRFSSSMHPPPSAGGRAECCL